MEDRLREYRFLDDDSNPDQKAILLGQLESVRRELLEAAEVNIDRIVFGKDVVREVISFASMGERTSVIEGSPSPYSKASLKETSGLMTPRGATNATATSLFNLVASPSTNSMVSNSPSRNHGSKHLYSDYMNATWEKEPRYRENLRSNMALGSEGPRRYGLPSMSPSRTLKITHEDIYGPSANSNEPQENGHESQKYGGVVHIRDMLERAEKGLSAVAEAQVQRRTAPPKILSDGSGVNDEPFHPDNTCSGISEESEMFNGSTHVLAYDSEMDGSNGQGFLTPGRYRSEYTSNRGNKNNASQEKRNFRRTRRTSSKESKNIINTIVEEEQGLTPVVGKLAGWAFVLGSIAAATMVASSGLRSSSFQDSEKETKNDRKSISRRNSQALYDNNLDARKADSIVSSTSNSNSGRKGKSKYGSSSEGRKKSSGSKSSKSLPPSSKRSVSPSQAPVMHVHQPPASETFPSNPPPDVKAAMG